MHEDLKKAAKAAVSVVAYIVAGSLGQVQERHGIDLRKAEEICEALRLMIGKSFWCGFFRHD